MKEHIAVERANVLVVGLARDCADVIQDEIRTLHKALTGFNSVAFLVIESDSEDETLVKLEAMQSEMNLQARSLGTLRASYPSRTQRIAICRNEYLKCLRQQDAYRDIDYVIVADLDGVNRQLTPEAVQSCWFEGADWDACFANQSAPYYDIWALRHPVWSPDDCFEKETVLRAQGAGDYVARKTAIFDRMITIDPKQRPIRVQSAFGGLGIYKKHLFEAADYVGLDAQGDEVCEHVSVHLEMEKTAKLYVMPSLINGGYNDHSLQMKLGYRILFYLATRFISIDRLRRLRRAVSR